MKSLRNCIPPSSHLLHDFSSSIYSTFMHAARDSEQPSNQPPQIRGSLAVVRGESVDCTDALHVDHGAKRSVHENVVGSVLWCEKESQ